MKQKRRNSNIEEKTEETVDVTKLNSTSTRVVYWVFQVLIIGTMIASIVQLCVADSQVRRNTQATHIILCAVALILYNVPSFAQKRFKLYVPTTLHIFILIFIFAHFILGEVVGVYTTSAVFDKILHSTSGLAIAMGGFSAVNLLNKNSSNTHLKLNPFFVAFFSFCFALAIALLWEVFEYASDSIFGTNMQRYKPPTGLVQANPPKQGYGLVDTMGDIIVSTVSALVVCVVGYFWLKRKNHLLNRFLLHKMSDYETAIAEAREAGDEKLATALEKAKAEALAQMPEHVGKENEISDTADGTTDSRESQGTDDIGSAEADEIAAEEVAAFASNQPVRSEEEKQI